MLLLPVALLLFFSNLPPVSIQVLNQLQCSGMGVALRLLQAGYPTRVGFRELYDRYCGKFESIFTFDFVVVVVVVVVVVAVVVVVVVSRLLFQD